MDEISVYAAPYEVGVGRLGWMLVRQDQGRLERVAPVSDWLMAIEPGCSPNSLERWARSLSLWWRWCVDTDVDPLRPTAVIFSKYVTSLQTRAKRKTKGRGAPSLSGNVALLPGDKRLRSSSTVRQRVDDVKRFYAWTVQQGCFAPKANAQQIARYKSPRSSQVRTAPRLMPDEVKIMQATRWHPRDVLWRELFHGAGLRSGEGLGLVTEDMCVTAEVASVYGCWAFSRFGPHLHVRQREDHPRGARSKARMHEAKPRVVPLTTRTVMAYQDWQVWLFEHMPEAIESRYLLLSLGGSTRGRPWSYDGLKDRSNELFKRIPGLEATTPHLLRHTYASELADAGVDSMTIQELLGHRSAASTEIYTHRMAAALVEGVSKLSQWRENAIRAQ